MQKNEVRVASPRVIQSAINVGGSSKTKVTSTKSTYRIVQQGNKTRTRVRVRKEETR